MNLYAWQPQGHGEFSFFVMAENEEEALYAVKRFIFKEEQAGKHCDCEGFGTDYYELTVLAAGQVITNDND